MPVIRDGNASDIANNGREGDNWDATDGEMSESDREGVSIGYEDSDLDWPSREDSTTAAEARRGKDIQGIPWNTFGVARQDHRETRRKDYDNYQHFPMSGLLTDMEFNQMEKGGNYYEFWLNTRLVKPTYCHFQLRNLVWANSKHDVYAMSNNLLVHWSVLTSNLTEVVNFSGHVAPVKRHNGNLVEGFTGAEITSLSFKDALMVVGGFHCLGKLSL